MRARVLAVVAGVVAAGIAAAVLAGAGRGHARPRPPSAATVAYGSFHSVALRSTDHYSIYLPPGYRDSTRRYPVIYFLHGLPQSSGAYRSIGGVVQAVRQSGQQAIVVGAQGARSSDPDPEWLDHGPGENWETATAVELVHVIDRRYRTIASRAGRVLLGISAGGYGAMLIGSHHPATYSVIESWSGYFHPTDPAGTAPLDLGSEEANDWANFHKLIPMLEDSYGPWWRNTWFGFYVGTNDWRFRDENKQTYRELRAIGAPHLTFAVYRGGHDWGLWQRHAPGWVRMALDAAAKPR